MREIKFRALGVDANWRYGSPSPAQSDPYSINLASFFANLHVGALLPQTCCEFTGLLDKNGKEIYEGDILKGVYNRYPQNWEVGKLSAYGLSFTRLTIEPRNPPYNYRDMRHREKWEVIGNIYENPDV